MTNDPVKNAPAYSIQEIATHIAAEIYNPAGKDLTRRLKGLAPLTLAREGELTFLTNPQFASQALSTQASAIISRSPIAGSTALQLLHPRPGVAMALASQLFYRPQHSFQGQSPLAYIDPTARVHPTAIIYPFAYVGPDSTVGEACVLYPHTYIGGTCTLGARTVLYPGAVLMDHTHIGQDVIIHGGAVLGADGFGFAPDQDCLQKIPQVGRVVIEDDVEIGPLATIDRATFAATIIRRGAKLDSQVHVGHNTEVGEMTMLCGQVGIAGSVKIGKRCIAAGQAGISQGLQLGDGVIIGAKSAMLQSESTPGEYIGIPAVSAPLWRRQAIALKKLPDLLKSIKRLEDKVAALEAEDRSQRTL